MIRSTTYQLFERAEQLELVAARIYEELAVRFSSNAGAHDLFKRLAAEELQHASRVRLLAARYRQDSRLLGAISSSAEVLQELVEAASAALAAVQAGAWDGDAERALGRASELELRFAEGHAQALIREANPDVRRFFEQLAAQDRAHLALLSS